MSEPLDNSKRAISHASLPGRRLLNSSGVAADMSVVAGAAARAPPRAMSAWSLNRRSPVAATGAGVCDKHGMMCAAMAAACVLAALARSSLAAMAG